MQIPDSSTTQSPATTPVVRPGRFPATRWTLVLAAQGSRTLAAEQALAELCQTYWRPVYVFVRGRGHSRENAEDLTQGFFAQLLERGSLATASSEKGRLRTFLLTAVERYLINEHARSNRQKRGGGRIHIPLDTPGLEPSDGFAPDVAYQRQWALTLLENVLATLKLEYENTGRSDIFEALKSTLSCDASTPPYTEIAEKLGRSEGAIKVAAHRLRQYYAQLLRDQIAETVSSPADIEDEIRCLFSAFSTTGK